MTFDDLQIEHVKTMALCISNQSYSNQGNTVAAKKEEAECCSNDLQIENVCLNLSFVQMKRNLVTQPMQ